MKDRRVENGTEPLLGHRLVPRDDQPSGRALIDPADEYREIDLDIHLATRSDKTRKPGKMRLRQLVQEVWGRLTAA